MTQPRIGSQLFINRGDRPEQAKAWVQDMAKTGLKVIRLFMDWDLVERREGVWDFDVFDAVFDEAKEQGLGVVPTLYSLTAPGWMRLARSAQDIHDITDEHFTQKGMEYIDRVVQHYVPHAALDSWIIWNEASLDLKPEKRYEKLYIEFLKSYHGDIENYNKLNYHQFNSFEEIKLLDADATDFWAPHIEKLDWFRFNRHMLMTWIKTITERIRKNDPHHPIHVNPHALATNTTFTGQEVWEEGEIVDHLGCSAHPVWHFTRFEREQWPQAIAMSTILMRSASKGEKFWLSELQAGPAIDSGVIYDTPSAEDLGVWIWNGISTGAEAVVFWCFNDRDDGAEAGEWRLMGPQGQETKRSRRVQALAQRLEQHRDWFESSKALQPKAVILHSTPSRTFAALSSWGDKSDPRSQESCDDAICGAWLLLDQLNIEAGFVNENKVCGLDPNTTPLLICPNVTRIESEQLLGDLQNYVRSGGTLILDGAFGSKDQEGWMRRNDHSAIEELTGTRRLDQTVFRGEQEIQGAGQKTVGWFLKNECETLENTESLMTWPDGDPAVTSYRYGNGCCISITTCAFQHFFAKGDGGLKAAMETWLPQNMHQGSVSLQPECRNNRLRHSVLQSDRGELHLFINDGPAKTIRLTSRGSGSWMDLEQRVNTPFADDTSFEIELPARDTFIMGVQA